MIILIDSTFHSKCNWCISSALCLFHVRSSSNVDARLADADRTFRCIKVGTSYEGVTFSLDIVFPAEYPYIYFLSCLKNLLRRFTEFGGPVPHRPAEDMASSVARFVQKGGSFVNYYMYHGGTNFGRTAGGPFIATSYDYDAPLDEYGINKDCSGSQSGGHLNDLHRAIKLCEPALVSGDPIVTHIGHSQESHVFKPKSGACAAFLANYDSRSTATAAFGDRHYNLPP
ncbi:hypothetical protein K1719_018931 [Acacia pycnantha]|nr:hypothetical protein K1719_018931 [Acacia pycnantha]